MTDLDVALALAEAAAGETLSTFRSTLGVEDKGSDRPGDFDPVTEADRAAEAAMRAVLAATRPDDAILGEEVAARSGTTGRRWTLDPIDGTRAYLAGAPTWGTLIAVGPDGGAPEIGIVDQPYIRDRFVGTPEGAWLDRGGDRTDLAVRGVDGLSDAILLTTFPEVGTEAEGAAFADLSRKAKLTRYGLDCYGYALVAGGWADAVIEAGLAPYDICAPMALVQAAGGIVTAWDGGPAQEGGRVIAAGCPAVHEAALEVLSKVPA